MKFMHWLAVASATPMLLAFTGTVQAMSAVPDWNMAGIPHAGLPYFRDAVKVTLARDGSDWKLTATEISGTQLFQKDSAHAYALSNASFMLTANFDSSLDFTGGNMEIKGKIPGLGVNSLTSLWKASLSGFGVDTNPFDGSPIALGFKTSGESGWATQFSHGSPESVYLFDPQLATLALNLFNPREGSVSVNASALTTVPLPAAAWLLGSGLIGLFGFRHKGASAAKGTLSSSR